MSKRRGNRKEETPRGASRKRKADSDPESVVLVKSEADEENFVNSDISEGNGSRVVKTEIETRWEWQGDGDMWISFSPVLNDQINVAFSSGEKFVTVSPVSGVSLKVDMKKMLQKNTKTGYQRLVRIAVQDHDKYFVWQWLSDDSDWISYDACTSVNLETVFQSEAKSVSLEFGGRQYTIDLEGMVQKNNQTQHERQIRRCISDSESSLQQQNHINVPPKKARGSRNTKNVENAIEENKEQVRTLVLKGKAPVDIECTTKLKKARVYCEGDDVYDVMLNQTNLQYNNNKFYLIQLLEDDNIKNFSVWMRWGRVGQVGQSSLKCCGSDLQKAKGLFEKKFFDKTKNVWSERANFEKVAGKYDILQMDYNSTSQEELKPLKEEKPEDIPPPESQLDSRVQELIEFICNLKAMEETVMEMKYDTKKAPLGKLTVEQIRAGYSSLQLIESCIKKHKFGRDLLEACNEFYTRIPHDFGLRTPPLIKTLEELAIKVRLLEALGDIQIAVKLANMELNSLEHPIDRQYRQLNCSLKPLDTTSSYFQLLERYLQSTHAPTHNDYTMKLLQVFELQREGEECNFRLDLPNRMLLWHGSRLTNWVGILSQGLRVAPPEAPVTGYMFGKGIYFADVSSKSANYCFTSHDKNVGILLLSEVALGECNELIAADYDAQKKLKGKNSTKGLGRLIADPQNSTMLDGALIPMGPLKETGLANKDGYTLNYNEYIVYDPHQVRMKYLLQVRFNYNCLW